MLTLRGGAFPIAAACCLLGAGGADAAYLGYEHPVAVEGRLVWRTCPGRPNDESVAAGDEPERVPILILSRPVCTTGGDPADPGAAPLDALRRVQVPALPPAIPRPAGQRVRLSGTLVAAHTGHHHAPLLLEPGARLRPAP
ncbi:DUF4431 domain-containing protein [Methylobacterium sp. JK268]